MTLVNLIDIHRAFSDFNVLDGLSLRVDDHDRMGVIGDNGAGKTTMIRILAGVDEADLGQRNTKKELRVAYGEQMPTFRPDDTVKGFVTRGNGAFVELETRIRAAEDRMASHPEDESALQDWDRLHGAFEAGGGYERGPMISKVLDGLGFPEATWTKPMHVLSGGELSRVVLAALMTTPADLLILDEPTNHLDLEGIEFVEGLIGKHPGAVIVISHDRRFLDTISKSIVMVEGGTATVYVGNYSAYKAQRELALLAEKRAFKSQQDYVGKEREYIRRNMGSRMTAQAKGRLKRLERMAMMDRPKKARKSMQVALGTARGREGQTMIQIEKLRLSIPATEHALARTLVQDATFRLLYGETLGILGPNGAGKTTMLRCLAGVSTPNAGTIERAYGVTTGYFSQDKAELPDHGTVLEALRALDVTVDDKILRDHLGTFLFTGDDVNLDVANLSGGEKQRLSLAILTRSTFDLLCLDEPTNHLDISSVEGLSQALNGYPGSALIVSHDRAFLEEVADRVLWVEDGAVRVFERGLEQCMKWHSEHRRSTKEVATPTTAPTAGKGKTKAKPASAQQKKGGKSKQGAAKQSQPKPAKPKQVEQKIRNPLMFEKLEKRIMELEENLKQVRAKMALEVNYTDHEKLRDLQHDEAHLDADLTEALEKWENW